MKLKRVIILALALLLLSAAAVPTAVQAAPPRFRVPSLFRVINANPTPAQYELTVWNASGTYHSEAFSLAAGDRRSFDLAGMADVPTPFTGSATIISPAPITWEYYLESNNANVTLHDLSGVGGPVELRYTDAAGAVLSTYPLTLTANGVLDLKQIDYPRPANTTGVEFGAGFAIEQYRSSGGPVIK